MEVIKKGDPRLKPFEDKRDQILALMNKFNCSISDVYTETDQEQKDNKKRDTIYVGGINNDYNPA